MKKKVHKLSFTPKYEFSLIGISSHENDYRLSWDINANLNMKLTKTQNLTIYNKKHATYQEFSHYVYHDEDSMISYHLIANKGEMGFLAREFQNIDFFLKIDGEGHGKSDAEALTGKLKKLDTVMIAATIDLSSIKQPDKFLF